VESCDAHPAEVAAAHAHDRSFVRPAAGPDHGVVSVAARAPLRQRYGQANEVRVVDLRSAEDVHLRAQANLPCAVKAGSGAIMMVSCGTRAYRLMATRSTIRLSSATTIALIASSGLDVVVRIGPRGRTNVAAQCGVTPLAGPSRRHRQVDGDLGANGDGD